MLSLGAYFRGSGLGIGTSADALIRHGIETDIVELDPVVYRYAKEYFGLAENHTVYIEDALVFIARELAKDSQQKRYDYILHDVFTGGAVPAALFTQEVFLGLRTLMSDDGVIAIVSAYSLPRLLPPGSSRFRASVSTDLPKYPRDVSQCTGGERVLEPRTVSHLTVRNKVSD